MTLTMLAGFAAATLGALGMTGAAATAERRHEEKEAKKVESDCLQHHAGPTDVRLFR
jgi:hypothetical protein